LEVQPPEQAVEVGSREAQERGGCPPLARIITSARSCNESATPRSTAADVDSIAISDSPGDFDSGDEGFDEAAPRERSIIPDGRQIAEKAQGPATK